MAESWTDISGHFRDLHERCQDASFRAALTSVERLAGHIGEGPLAGALFGWSSMWDLCVQQSDVEPYSGPFLRVSPQADGTIEFRYHDTAIEHRQWNRRVPPDGVVGRFDAFLDQLRWR
jgi:hypothetical protein